MKPHIEEAVQVLRVAARDIQAFDVLKEAPEVHISIVCFHAQQAIEKSLKAVLFLHQIEFRRTHNLTELAELLHQNKIETPVINDQLERLNPFAVTLRYGDDIEIELISRDTATKMVNSIFEWAEELLNLATGEH
jgi:HEPN domain-containing protein